MEEFLGTVKLFAGTFIPNGWAECNGQLLNIHSSEALYSIILTTYGGDGMSTFALPDLRGRVPVGLGARPDGSTYGLGDTGGKENVKLTLKNVPAHSHTAKFNLSATNGDSEKPEADSIIGMPNYADGRISINSKLYNKAKADVANAALVTVEPTGEDKPDAIDLRQPFIGMRYIICCQGMYPPHS